MEFHYEKLTDPLVYKEGCTAPHSDHRFYRTEAEAAAGKSSFRYELNGLWRFHYGRNYGQTIPHFEAPAYSCKNWEYIRVPSHIQLEGYDAPQYANVQYPWEGREELIPGQIPRDFNPVASYVKYFTLPAGWCESRTFLVLEGAESAAAVWLNGHYIGYHEDSFTPAELEVTDCLLPGENKLAVQVFKWCQGSWCEDQDFFRFSGLYRDVYLFTIPRTHLRDLWLRAEPSEDLRTAELSVRAELLGAGSVEAELLDGEKLLYRECRAAGEAVEFHAELEHPKLWSAEEPYLYTCRLTVKDENGEITEHLRESVGFRRFEMRDGLMCLNGKRIVFRGVNRHEFSCVRGRALTDEEIEADLKIIKQNNINAIRTSHYPNRSSLYRLCDRYGVYLIDETNLESHGSWDETGRPDDKAHVVPGDRPEWRGMMTERAASLFERDKNHPSILIWSCGNEAFGGSVIHEMSELFRKRDRTRLVHYEGIFHDRRYPDTSDMESQMYTPVSGIEAFLREHPEKPFICCEYAHAMGNSCGGLWKYTELTEREPRYQGGFIWDFADQALVQKNAFGENYYAYGGDFDDRPTDYSFSGDGLVSGDRQLTPKMQEVKFLYQPLKLTVSRDQVEVWNQNLFLNADHWDCRAEVRRNGVSVEKKSCAVCVQAGERKSFPLQLREQTAPGYYTITVSFCLREAELWAEAGHEIAFGQACYEIPEEKQQAALPLEVIHSKHNIGVRGDGFEVLFSLLNGGLTSYRYGGQELLSGIPRPNFWRAPTDNDRGNLMAARYAQWKIASLYLSHKRATAQGLQLLPHAVEEKKNSVVVTFHYWMPTTPESFCEVSYEVFGDGTVETALSYDPVEGLPEMPEFGLLLPLKAEFDHLTWYGLGPADTYADRKCGGKTNLYQNLVSDNLTPYLVPQECGSKEQVRFASVTDSRGRGMWFQTAAPDGCSFSALPYTPHQLEEAEHPFELPRSVRTIVRISLAQMGVGGDDSWGARTHPEYLLPKGERLSFRFSFRGL